MKKSYLLYLSGIIAESVYMDILAEEQQAQDVMAQLPVPPQNELQKYYIETMLRLYKPATVLHLANNPNFYQPQMMYKIILESLYKNLRVPNRKEGEHYDDVPHDADIDAVTSASNQLVAVMNKGGWFYRQPYSYSKHPRAAYRIGPDEKEGRLSFAALANKKLIDVLDDYVANRRLAYYKTPDSEQGWTERHDPITMYFKEPITDEVKAELAQIFNNKDFNRALHKNNPLTGHQFAPGMAQEFSPQKSQIQQAIAQVQAINPEAAKVAQEYLTDPKGELKASAGQMQVISQFEKLLPLERKSLSAPKPAPKGPQASPQPAPKGPQVSPQQGPQSTFSLRSIADKVGDINWQTVHDAFDRSFQRNPKDPEVQKMGQALYQAYQTGDMRHIKDYVQRYVYGRRV